MLRVRCGFKPPMRRFSSSMPSASAEKGKAKKSSAAAAGEQLWELIVGTEVHAQITSASKLFSGAATLFGSAPNSQVAWVDAGLPGALPALNERCVSQAIRAGFALRGHVNKVSFFERKHYSYCDLPLGYQITQQTAPIVHDASLELDDMLSAGQSRTVRIERIQLEIDSGKNLHDVHDSLTFVDLNRAGMPLLEIVSRPDMRSIDEVLAYIRKLSGLLRHLHICAADMSKSQLRVDLNISVRPKREHPKFAEINARISGTKDEDGRGLGTRVEVKNLNSLRSMTAAMKFEFSRQIAEISQGNDIERETRAFDAARGQTIRLRSKEDLLDYRFCPDPDLPILQLSQTFLDHIKEAMPELPDAIASRWRQQFGLSKNETGIIVSDPDTVDFFNAMIYHSARAGDGVSHTLSSNATHGSAETKPARDPQKCANWLVTELFGRLHSRDIAIKDSPVKASQVASIVDSISAETISGAIGKRIIDLMFAGDVRHAHEIAQEKDWLLIADTSIIEPAVDATILEQSNEVAELRRVPGSFRIFDFLVGCALKKLKFKASPAKVASVMRGKISM